MAQPPESNPARPANLPPERLLAAIVDSSDDAVVSKDLNGVVTSWNKGAQRIFGYTAEEMIGQSIVRLMPPDRVNEEPVILARLRRGERVEHFETVRVRKDGRLIDVSLTISRYEMIRGKLSARRRSPGIFPTRRWPRRN
jgi:PAS domain S-box-containing protein